MPQRRLRDRDEVAGICVCEQLEKEKKRFVIKLFWSKLNGFFGPNGRL